MRRVLLVLALVLAMIVATIGPAAAGEINGKGERPMVVGYTDDGHTILHGKSLCAFSGLNDEYLLGLPSDGFGRTQNWGQIPKAERDFIAQFGAHPGNACNPNGDFSEG